MAIYVNLIKCVLTTERVPSNTIFSQQEKKMVYKMSNIPRVVGGVKVYTQRWDENLYHSKGGEP